MIRLERALVLGRRRRSSRVVLRSEAAALVGALHVPKALLDLVDASLRTVLMSASGRRRSQGATAASLWRRGNYGATYTLPCLPSFRDSTEPCSRPATASPAPSSAELMLLSTSGRSWPTERRPGHGANSRRSRCDRLYHAPSDRLARAVNRLEDLSTYQSGRCTRQPTTPARGVSRQSQGTRLTPFTALPAPSPAALASELVLMLAGEVCRSQSARKLNSSPAHCTSR